MNPELRIQGERAEPQGAQRNTGKRTPGKPFDRNSAAKPDSTFCETSAKRLQPFRRHPQTRTRSKHSDIPSRRSPHTDKQNNSAALLPAPARVLDRVPA